MAPEYAMDKSLPSIVGLMFGEISVEKYPSVQVHTL